jgi:ATP-dependent Zn protease
MRASSKSAVAVFFAAMVPVLAFAQEYEEKSSTSTWTAALITWAPVFFLVVLWIFFMRRMNVYGKGGMKEYIRIMQERTEKIEGHLADIASSLRKIAERNEPMR